MFCSQCGQQQFSGDSIFCSNCGLRLQDSTATGTFAQSTYTAVQPIYPACVPYATRAGLSPRQRGIRHGVMLMASTFLAVPLTGILGVAMLDWPVELVAAVGFICFFGGILRILHAVLFQDNASQSERRASMLDAPAFVPAPPQPYSMPRGAISTAQHAPTHAAPPNGWWKDSTADDFPQPGSVTENTTRLLHYRPARSQGNIN